MSLPSLTVIPPILTLTFVLAVGAMALTGCGRDEPTAQAEPQPETAMEHAKKHLDPTYVCPMHPQVVSLEPGRCPICGMDLVAKKTEPSPADESAEAAAKEVPSITVSGAVVSQLGVRTAEVRRGTLTRHIEGPGVVVRSTQQGYRPSNRGRDPGASATGTSASALLLLGEVFEGDAPLVHQGQAVRVRFPSLDSREWEGKVSSLENQISQTTHTFQFRVAMETEGTYVPGGMTAQVTLEAEPLVDVLLIPREAVIQTGKGARVIVARGGGRFEQREVEAEDFGEDEMVIHSGLEGGDQVVVSAQFLLDSEANLQAGLSRLTGGKASDHIGHEREATPSVMHKEGMHDEAMHEAAMPHAAMQEPPMPEGSVPEGSMPQQDMHEGTMQ